MSPSLKENINSLPVGPGVYQYYDADGTLLYIGKAKNLRSRVRSYFTGDQFGKTRVLVNKIADLKFIVVPTEQDALLLENNLIKEYKPPYNILLKDDKTYPWICIKNERFPRVFSTRNVKKDGSRYFGPYTNVKVVNTLLKLISSLFKLRNCNYDLSEINISSGKYKVCLEYHLGNCLGPCVGEEELAVYDSKIDQIKNILNGNLKTVRDYLFKEMLNASEALEFEKANELKECLTQIEEFQSKNTVVSNTITNVDVFNLYVDDNRYFVNYFKISDGAIIQSHTAEIKIRLNESITDILLYYILSLRAEFNSQSKEIILPFELEFEIPNGKVVVPKIGDKLKLLELSKRNARFYALDKKLNDTTPVVPNERVLKDMQKKLRLSELPRHIECFDNSNIQGTHPVSACVVFKDGKPSKKDYRHFNITTVEGPDDFASMVEAITRRYTRLLKENKQLPQLIIIDGGKGQLSSAVAALKDVGVYGKIAVVGIAKRLEEIYFPGDSDPIYIDKKSECLKLIQYLRNEAHRFGITHHRNRRSKSMIKSDLENISGIGSVTLKKLLTKYKSLASVKNAHKEELRQILNKKQYEALIAYLGI